MTVAAVPTSKAQWTNLVALAGGLCEVMIVMVGSLPGGALKLSTGVTLSIILVIAALMLGWLIAQKEKNPTAMLTVLACTGLAILVLVFIVSQPAAAQPTQQYKRITGEIYHDINKNGQRDGSDEDLINIEILIRDRTMEAARTYTGSDGKFNTEVANSLVDAFIVVCGVSQSHRIPAQGQKLSGTNAGLDIKPAYYLKIGIELEDISACS